MVSTMRAAPSHVFLRWVIMTGSEWARLKIHHSTAHVLYQAITSNARTISELAVKQCTGAHPSRANLKGLSHVHVYIRKAQIRFALRIGCLEWDCTQHGRTSAQAHSSFPHTVLGSGEEKRRERLCRTQRYASFRCNGGQLSTGSGTKKNRPAEKPGYHHPRSTSFLTFCRFLFHSSFHSFPFLLHTPLSPHMLRTILFATHTCLLSTYLTTNKPL